MFLELVFDSWERFHLHLTHESLSKWIQSPCPPALYWIDFNCILFAFESNWSLFVLKLWSIFLELVLDLLEHFHHFLTFPSWLDVQFWSMSGHFSFGLSWLVSWLNSIHTVLDYFVTLRNTLNMCFLTLSGNSLCFGLCSKAGYCRQWSLCLGIVNPSDMGLVFHLVVSFSSSDDSAVFLDYEECPTTLNFKKFKNKSWRFPLCLSWMLLVLLGAFANN